MSEIQIDKAIEAAGKEAQSMLDKFFTKLADTKVKDGEAGRPFPNGIGVIKIVAKISATISLEFTVADVNYKSTSMAEYWDSNH
jgi:hypothetical protein